MDEQQTSQVGGDGATAPVATGGGSGGGGLFQCFQCKRNYTRADHLARHVRSHTQEKPFPCTICSKRFSRADLLKRHFLNHDENNDNKRQRRARPPTAPGRVTQACRACALAKLKCEEEKPCHRCQQKGMKCEYVQQDADRLRKYAKTAPKQGEQQQQHLATDTIIYRQTPSSTSTLAPPVFGDANYATTTFPGTQAATPETLPDGSVSYGSCDSNPFAGPSPFGGFGRDTMHVEHPSDMQAARHPASRDLLNFGMMTDLELNEMDIGLLDTYNEMFMNTLGVPAMDFTQQQQQKHHHQPPPSGSPPVISAEQRAPIKTTQLALGVSAYRKSHLRWVPNRQDRGNSEHENFSIPSDANPKITMSNRRLVSGRIDIAARDRILAVVLTTCDFRNRLQAVSSFPTAELLDNLMNLFFHSQQETIDTWIHPATFNPSTTSPELLTAIVAAGAVLTPLPALRKLGYALQEAVRVALPKLFEANNSFTRDLKSLQAYLLEIEISLWSGNERRIEIAESFRNPIATMLRRSGKYRRAQYPPITPSSYDEGEVLEERWRDWIQQQQFLRLVYQLFMHDIQASISYQVNPIISYAELSLPLPESRQLFFARSATEWKSIYLSAPLSPNPRLPSFIDSLREFPDLTIPPGVRIDLDFAELVMLYGHWGRIWDFRQRQAIWHTSERETPPSIVVNIDRGALAPRFSAPQCRLLLEVLAMAAYVSLEDLQAFAGKEDEEECVRVSPVLQMWIHSSDSRRAVWHAGQVLREARGFRKGQLNCFWAVVVYHAAITLWSYGTLINGRESSGTPFDEGEEEGAVVLDGADMRAVAQFVEFGRGKPRICSDAWGGAGDVDVHSPGAVMDAACQLLVLYSTAEGDEGSLPPLVRNLCVLMEELGEAAEKERVGGPEPGAGVE